MLQSNLSNPMLHGSHKFYWIVMKFVGLSSHLCNMTLCIPRIMSDCVVIGLLTSKMGTKWTNAPTFLWTLLMINIDGGAGATSKCHSNHWKHEYAINCSISLNHYEKSNILDLFDIIYWSVDMMLVIIFIENLKFSLKNYAK